MAEPTHPIVSLAGGPLGDAAGQVGGVVHCIQDFDGAVKVRLAGRGQLDVTCGANQQYG